MFRRRACALAPLTASALWGGMYVVSKWGFASIPPVTLGFLRVALGGAVLLGVVRFRYPARDFSRADRRRFLVLGGWIALTIVSQFVGTDLTTASQGSLLTVLTPVFTLLLGVVVLSEPLTRRRVAGMALAVAGTLLVLSGRYDLGSVSAGNLLGVAMLLVASAAWAGYTVWGKPAVRAASALETATYSTLAAVPILGVAALVELATTPRSLDGGTLSLPVLGAVAYLGVASTALAWYLWYRGLEYVDAGTVSVFFFAQPLVGAALGALLLDERLGPTFAGGGLVMAAGVLLVSTDPGT